MIILHNNGTNLLNYKIGVSWKFSDQFVVKFFMSFEHTSIIKLLKWSFVKYGKLFLDFGKLLDSYKLCLHGEQKYI